MLTYSLQAFIFISYSFPFQSPYMYHLWHILSPVFFLTSLGHLSNEKMTFNSSPRYNFIFFVFQSKIFFMNSWIQNSWIFLILNLPVISKIQLNLSKFYSADINLCWKIKFPFHIILILFSTFRRFYIAIILVYCGNIHKFIILQSN